MMSVLSSPRSSKGAKLASYDHAYAVAVQKQRETGRPQFVLRTGDALQPFRVSTSSRQRPQSMMTFILCSGAFPGHPVPRCSRIDSATRHCRQSVSGAIPAP